MRTASPVRLDGRLDEADWANAPPITAFTQNDPQEGAPVSERTVVRLLYDGAALYVGAWLADREPVSRRLGRRDAWLENSDWFSIALDSYRDRLTAYRFMVNPSGVRSDEVLSGGNADHGDNSWDPVWEAATAVTDSGWVAELRIPFSQLRFSKAEVQEWGLQLERTIARRQEEAVFAFTPKAERGGVARYGVLTGLRSIHPGRGVEVVPYVVARAEYQPIDRPEAATFANPYRDGSDWFSNAGVDLKYRVASNATIDATLNPDFGQVELDPAVINLTAYETQFEEKRPFFVEGGDIFEFGGEAQLVYSRRMGARPSVRAPAGTLYSDVPESSTILGAAKLTGRGSGGWSFGIGDAVTAEERAHFALADGSRRSAVAAPLTNFLVGRVKRTFRRGETWIGALGTSVERRLERDAVVGTSLTPTLRTRAYTGGADFSHEWANRSWRVEGALAGSWIEGSAASITAAQRSSARYYQRPDAAHIELDPAATTMSGYDTELSVSKEAGLHWRGELQATATSPGFEVNDVGYQRLADRKGLEGSLMYVENRPGRVLRNWRIGAGSGTEWNYGGDYLGAELGVEAEGQLLSYWNGSLDVEQRLSGYDDRLTRGGPLTRGPASTSVRGEVESDDRRPVVVQAEGGWSRDEAGGSSHERRGGVEIRPAASWSLSVGPEYGREHNTAQYVGSVPDPLVTRTYGRRYLFADLEQQTLSMDTRLNVTFSPALTFELWLQPLIGSGAFNSVKELLEPRTFRFRAYGRDIGTVQRAGRELIIDPDGTGPAPSFTVADEDFNSRSLRGNAVLRWEWRPGSTLFLVWQQVRESEEWRADLALRHSAGELLRAPAQNVFQVKLTYWLGT
ncbi:MAG: carbohydrate binding family 9 domain-containing protein [Gemmatimonadetes bacterium]|nr:carbohydrate binding family 9 domain-containing protein [Gemmatimonadota bacterium]